jgi:RNA polymerase sigma-70 factor (ECF subfamily)
VASLSDPALSAQPASQQDHDLVDRLRAGDEDAFRELVTAWSPAMLRLARGFVSGAASAQDVVQDAWLGVIKGLDRFEGRSSLRAWVFTIVVNQARTRGVREARTTPMSQYTRDDDNGPTVDASRFQGPDGEYPGHWTSMGAPQHWDEVPDRRVLAREAIALVEAAIEQLPPRQRLVVTLRDVHGVSSDETCAVLEISAENQRVLLHRGRAALRTTLEGYYRR